MKNARMHLDFYKSSKVTGSWREKYQIINQNEYIHSIQWILQSRIFHLMLDIYICCFKNQHFWKLIKLHVEHPLLLWIRYFFSMKQIPEPKLFIDENAFSNNKKKQIKSTKLWYNLQRSTATTKNPNPKN